MKQSINTLRRPSGAARGDEMYANTLHRRCGAENEFGEALDRNGYAPSILQKGRESLLGGISGPNRCYVCTRREGRGFLEKLERHEPWNAANRTKSKNLGLWVTVCRECHEEAHRDPCGAGRELKKDAQRAAMLRYGWSREEWIRRFGKSELSEEEAARVLASSADAVSHKWKTAERSAARPFKRESGFAFGEEEQSSAQSFRPLGRKRSREICDDARAGGFRVIAEPEMPY